MNLHLSSKSLSLAQPPPPSLTKFGLYHRLVHGSGQVSFGPNLDSTRWHRVEGEEPKIDRWHQSIESVSGEDEGQLARPIARI